MDAVSTRGFFANAQNVAISHSTMIDHNAQLTDNKSIHVLIEHTIPGAEYDSSERDPPPQCHPGTRLGISESLHAWIHNVEREKSILWLHGPAGVGKSAIMQTLADNEANSLHSVLGATVFFSRPNERDDHQRLFTTIAYQLSVKYPAYRKYVIEILDNDPKITRKSMAEQFEWFIVMPFVVRDIFDEQQTTVLIILDGLDECKGSDAQRELVLLIGRFGLKYQDTPLIWVIASRPEPHIRAVFSNFQIRGCHWEIDVPVNSDQGSADVERFLRDKFTEIREEYPFFFESKHKRWPTEADFVKIANAASGLFIFATVVIRFIMDEHCGNPVSQLQMVLHVVDAAPMTELQSNPFATLDNLYAAILTGIPPEILPTTKKLLSLLFVPHPMARAFGFGCNIFEIKQADAYGALWKLHSVLSIPSPETMTDETRLKVFHASFSDYIKCPVRSGDFHVQDSQAEVEGGLIRCLIEAHDPWDATICSSRINVSWAYRDKAMVQKYLFRWSLVIIINTGVPMALHDDNVLDYELATFFGDVDYGDISALQLTPKQFCSQLCGLETIIPSLERWRVARRIKLDSVDLDRVRSTKPAAATTTRVRLDTEGAGSLPGFLFDSRRSKFDEVILAGSEPLNSKPFWKEHIHTHLQSFMNLHPPACIYMFGKGDRSAVCFRFNEELESESRWCYILPYHQT